MPKFMGIDYGLERTGAAISDPAGKIAFPFFTFTLSAYPNRRALIDDLVKKALDEGVEGIVMGWPTNLAGQETLMCRRVRNFAERIKRRVDIPVFFISEVLTSEIAKNFLVAAGKKKEKLRKALDAQAACIILQSFLDAGSVRNSP